MSARLRLVAAIVGGVTLMGGIPAMALADRACPPTVLTFRYAYQGSDVSVLAPAFDTTFVPSPYDSARVTFDRTAGRISLDALGRLWAWVRLTEEFDVLGAAPGTEVPATLVLRLDADVLNSCGGGGCGVYFTATLTCGAASVLADGSIPGPCTACTRSVHTTVSLPVTFVAGTPQVATFAMLYRTSHVAWGRTSALASYGVAGLPLGVRARACGGGDVTSVGHASWGRLKALYR